jgi:hypothetical protein
LLYDMGQFMCHKVPSGGVTRTVLSCPKDDVIACGERESIYRTRRLGSFGIGVDAHLAEVASETRFHEAARGVVERLARGPQYLVDDGWCRRSALN